MKSSNDETMPVPNENPPEFLRLRGYEVLREVSRGAQGIVYQARHDTLDRTVAIKVRRPGVSRERFTREAKIFASLKSPYIPIVYDYTVLEDERPVIIIEWIDGDNLENVIRSNPRPLPESKIQPWMTHVARGMKTSADEGIVHRDLKPSNILVNKSDQALVADFGIARSDLMQSDDLTTTQELMGTPCYMAPEQAEDPHAVDSRSDICSFGASFYHALTGKPPFEGKSWFVVLEKHKNEQLVSPQFRNKEISTRTNDVIERCLAKSPLDRFQSFGHLLASIESDTREMVPRVVEFERLSVGHFTPPPAYAA